jgi:hypothetical protein
VVDVEGWLAGTAERAASIATCATDVTDDVGADASNNVAIPADIGNLVGGQPPMTSPWRDDGTEERRRLG